MAHRVCPYLVGYLLVSPLRRWIHNPERILNPYVSEGMTVLDVGSAMGFFSLPMAAMVGPGGKVICLDVQEKMLLSLRKRAVKANMADRIIARLCRPDSLDLQDMAGEVDFSLGFAVVHEAADPAALFRDLFEALKAGGKCLVAEPKGHVSKPEFEETISTAVRTGFGVIDRPAVTRSHTALLVK